MAALASDWLRHFRLLFWNRWRETNKTWHEAKSQRHLPSLCFSGQSEKQDGRPGLWLAETFSTSFLKPLNGIQRNLTGSKISTSSTKFVFFGLIGKLRWPPWPLIGWDIFDFSSETAEGNLTKLDMKQDLNVLYQVCVFRADRKKTRWPPWPLIGWDIFDFSSETVERNSKKLDRKQDLNVLYQVCVFGRISKQKCPPWPIPQKVAHCTQVHDMWPFGPLVFSFSSTMFYRSTLSSLLTYCFVFFLKFLIHKKETVNQRRNKQICQKVFIWEFSYNMNFHKIDQSVRFSNVYTYFEANFR